MKRVLLGTFFTVIFVGVSVLVVVFLWPQVLINSSTANWALNRFGKAYGLSWDLLEVDAHSSSLFRKEISIGVLGLKVATPDGIQVRLPQLSVELKWNLRDLSYYPSATELTATRLAVTIGQSNAKVEEPAKKNEPNDLSGILDLVETIRALHIQRLAVSIESIRVEGVDYKLEASGGVGREGFYARAHYEKGKERVDAEAHARLELDTLLRYQLTAKHKTEEGILPIEAKGELDLAKAALSLSGSVPLNSFVSGLPESVRLAFWVKGQGTMAGNRLESVKADAGVVPKLPKAAAVDVDGEVKVSVSGKLEDVFKKLPLKTQWDLAVRIDAFHKFAAWLSSRGLAAIPQPIYGLGGTAVLRTQGAGERPWEVKEILLTLNTDLRSANQRVKIEGNGKIELFGGEKKDQTRLDADVSLQDIQLELPNLEWWKMPRIFPDSRVSTGRDLASTASTFQYSVRIATPKESRIRLLSRLSKGAIPLQLKLDLSSEHDASVWVSVSSFPLILFHRDAKVKFLEFTQSEKASRGDLRGEVVVTYTDYVIHIFVTGVADKPVIRFASDPPLSQDKLIAVLLFGKELDSLDSSQTESVGGMQGAITNRAIGLASLYLLASTPIESIGYDPQAGLFTAKVKLGDGTSLDVGSKAGSVKELGFRRRLSGEWSIRTYVQDPFAGGSVDTRTSAGAFLEWNRRY